MESDPPAEAQLVCAECGAVSEGDAAGLARIPRRRRAGGHVLPKLLGAEFGER
jgi:hypothetical protein